jgi:hypothetical protein
LFQTNAPKIFWSVAVLTVVHLMNQLPTAVLQHKNPIEIQENRKINLDHLRVFGCTCFVHVKRHDKFDKNAIKTIFLGYSSKQKRL